MSDFAFFNSTFNLTTLTSVGNQNALSVGIGGLTGGIGIFSFLFFLLPIHHHDVQFIFKFGIQGEDYRPGEELPWKHTIGARVYDNMGRFMKGTMRGYVCINGIENCVAHIHPVKRQPAYAMIQGAPRPVCLAAVGVRYESGDKYGWVGNWAQTCEQPWYYSAHNAIMGNETFGINCAWVGKRGYKRPHRSRHRRHRTGIPTGIRIHWVDFTHAYRSYHDNEYYCRDNNTALAFHRHKHPGFFDGTSLPERVYTRPREKEPPEKRAVGQAEEVEEVEEVEEQADEAQGQADEESARHMAPDISPGMYKRTVKSHMSHHSAKFLCESRSSAGPSLVAMSDRLFCHMPNRVLYQFCADVESGGCWDHEAHRFDAKGPGKIHARSALPNIVFDKPLVWGAPEGSS
ncbi:hypothetical protein E4U57_007531 [Claviceps arundinis]|uniref:Uncharacterized protein n=1 Tax=Claviceps arundinis TaxID=1623583 RepID=A0ABQ7PF29_9HYPO|nr:hypothetical protein E4U57_007531 [Claviceps arundinis]